jgi:gliding motility-associated-like protein
MPQIDVVSTIAPICSSKGTITASAVTGGVTPYTYSLNGVAFYNSNLFDSLTAGTYILSVKDSNGCLVDTAINLNSPSLNMPEIDVLSINEPFCNLKGIITVESVSGGQPPYWYSLNGVDFYNSNLFNNVSAGTYFLAVKDSNGCLADTIIDVHASFFNEVPIIPNCLTPNNDKINDEWYIESDCVEEFKCTILNRWGQIVKTMTDITEKWNGLYNDELLSEGVYTYILEIKYYNSPATTMSGFITLIR